MLAELWIVPSARRGPAPPWLRGTLDSRDRRGRNDVWRAGRCGPAQTDAPFLICRKPVTETGLEQLPVVIRLSERLNVSLHPRHPDTEVHLEQVGRETIRVLLQSHDLKPWREKNVVSRDA
jgi:hypothetical protein